MFGRLKLNRVIITVILVIALFGSIGTMAAGTINHHFRINQDLGGFTSRNGALTFETNITREVGLPGSLKVAISPGHSYASLTIRDNSSSNAHPDWLNDWTPYDHLSAWFYFEELDTMPDNKGVAVRIGGNKAEQVMIPKSQLQVGWNHIETKLVALVGNDASKLSHMDGMALEFIVDMTGMYIVDEIQLVMPDVNSTNQDEITSLIEVMRAPNYGEAMKAEKQLVQIGDEAVQALTSVLSGDSNSWNRVKAGNVLMRIGTESAITALIIGLEDQDETTRNTIKKHIENLDAKGKQIVRPLLVKYATDLDFNTRHFAIDLLRGTGLSDSDLATELMKALTDATPVEYEIILSQLSKLGLGAGNVIPELVALFDPAQPTEKLRLLEVITTIGGDAGRAVLPDLTEMLLDTDWDVRQKAIWGMRRLSLTGIEMVEPVLALFSEQQEHAVEILAQLAITQPEAVYSLTDILADTSLPYNARSSAYISLAGMVPQLEYHINRGLIAINTDQGVYLGWRLLGTDSVHIGFNIYRDGLKINPLPITTSTNYLDNNGSLLASYYIKPVVNGVELAASETVPVLAQNYLSVPISRPDVGETPGGELYSYSASECSVGGFTGDGRYDIVVKWEPSNFKDNAESGYTGNVYLDAYTMDGVMLWRIDLGHNVRAGLHYSPFLVYDFDGDGVAEMIVKTADGTIDGVGNVIGDPNVDYRSSDGRILKGPEYLTVFDGATGAALHTIDFKPERGNVGDWGDSYGNRVDRFLAGVAYLDGVTPSVIMCRGYYEKTVLVAYNWTGDTLEEVWTFDTSSAPSLRSWEGQGNHQISVADVDADGKDEIIYGAMTIDHDGTGLYNTTLGHGDALHVADHDPTRPGLEVFSVHETVPSVAGINLRDARTGEVIWGIPTNYDVGRGVAANIDPNYPGSETWAAGASLMDVNSNVVNTRMPNMCFVLWWDGDLQREILEKTTIYKWDWEKQEQVTVLSPTGLGSTTNKPPLQADLLGDWREEVIFRTRDNSELRIYTTTDITEYRLFTLMHDRMYRTSIAWQNVAYNQPPHPSFYVGEDMAPHVYNPGQLLDALQHYADEFVSIIQ